MIAHTDVPISGVGEFPPIPFHPLRPIAHGEPLCRMLNPIKGMAKSLIVGLSPNEANTGFAHP